ncbi:hypothetical protein CQ018_12365 [Arthrobacter sp. MYb227]|uniref:hypothetical protein n=1 Tax=Arthrobacter sp. MYb227 TaxID=1848601 RepID=UPI000CFCDCCB|nr:hypothetical protein [Arthrobacter sp. MYb227]PQZ92291.1 hypothetical protein CQ018_12365 [Arthrobacter sp. MYb227]
MGIDWEGTLGAERADLAAAYDDAVFEADRAQRSAFNQVVGSAWGTHGMPKPVLRFDETVCPVLAGLWIALYEQEQLISTWSRHPSSANLEHWLPKLQGTSQDGKTQKRALATSAWLMCRATEIFTGNILNFEGRDSQYSSWAELKALAPGLKQKSAEAISLIDELSGENHAWASTSEHVVDAISEMLESHVEGNPLEEMLGSFPWEAAREYAAGKELGLAREAFSNSLRANFEQELRPSAERAYDDGFQRGGFVSSKISSQMQIVRESMKAAYKSLDESLEYETVSPSEDLPFDDGRRLTASSIAAKSAADEMLQAFEKSVSDAARSYTPASSIAWESALENIRAAYLPELYKAHLNGLELLEMLV